MNKGDEPSDEKLLYLVGQVDAELFRSGVEIRRRRSEVPRRVMQILGVESYVVAGPGQSQLLARVDSVFASLYRPWDLHGGANIGVFMYRDIFARISVPHVFGTVTLNPFDCVDLTAIQLRVIQSEPSEQNVYLDQFSDVADIHYGSSELRDTYASVELTVRFLGLARLHLHSAAAIVTGGFDYRGAVQSALLATELALKCGTASQGLTEADIKSAYGHNLNALATFLGQRWSGFDSARVRRVILAQPKYVLNRYAQTQPGRVEVGHIVMGAQYIVSEVVRQMSDRNMRASLEPAHARRFPS